MTAKIYKLEWIGLRALRFKAHELYIKRSAQTCLTIELSNRWQTQRLTNEQKSRDWHYIWEDEAIPAR